MKYLLAFLPVFALCDIYADIEKCYNWNPPLWDYIIKNQSQDRAVVDIYTMCIPRGANDIKSNYHKVKAQKNLSDYELKLYEIMKGLAK